MVDLVRKATLQPTLYQWEPVRYRNHSAPCNTQECRYTLTGKVHQLVSPATSFDTRYSPFSSYRRSILDLLNLNALILLETPRCVSGPGISASVSIDISGEETVLRINDQA